MTKESIQYTIDEKTGEVIVNASSGESSIVIDEKTKTAILIFDANDEIISYGILEKAKMLINSIHVSEKIKASQERLKSEHIKRQLMS